MDEPAPMGEVTTHSAENAFSKVMLYCGASLYRDEVDARYMEEAQTGTATYKGSVTEEEGIIDLVSDVNGYTEANFPTGNRPAGYDSDNDACRTNGKQPTDLILTMRQMPTFIRLTHRKDGTQT